MSMNDFETVTTLNLKGTFFYPVMFQVLLIIMFPTNWEIELTGINTEKDAFDKIIEVDPTKELDLFKDKASAEAKGQLRIVEIEFYEKKDE